jgi:hypothetical protein
MNKPRRQPPTLIAPLMQALEKSGQGYSLAKEPLEAVARQGMALDSGAELYALVQQLVGFAGFLAEKQRSPEAAHAILRVAELLADRLTSLAQRDIKQSSQIDQALRKRIEKEKKALARAAGPEDMLGPQAGIGVGLRRRQ